MNSPVIPEKEDKIGKQGTRTYKETVETIKDMRETEEWKRISGHLEYLFVEVWHETINISDALIDAEEYIKELLQQQEKRLRDECANNHE